MTDLGHNGGPPLSAAELFAAEVDELFAVVSGSTAGAVTTDEQEAALDDLLKSVRRAQKDADARRADEKAPHLQASRDVDAAWKPLLDKCAAATVALKDALTPYRTAKQAAKDEAARKAREEAEERQRAAQAALKASDDLEARFEAEQELKTASKLTAVANRIDRSATGLRTYWEAEVTDARAALNHLIKRQPDRFAALVQQLADEEARAARAPIPGVIFHERKRAA